jgi:Helix-turn-helix domain
MRYLAKSEIEDIHKLKAEGWMIKDIARRFAVCEETISHHITRKTALRGVGKWRRQPKITPLPAEVLASELKEVDFSSLPDHVLFEHTRECNFIG